VTWWETIPTFAVAVVLIFLPGAAILAGAGVRRLNLAALAAPVSFTVASCLAVAAPFVGLRYTPTLYLVVCGVFALGVLGARVAYRRRYAAGRAGDDGTYRGMARLGGNEALSPGELGRWGAVLALPVALAVAASVITARYVSGFGRPEHFSQTFDNIYHLNAVKHIVATDNGSSLSVGNLTDVSSGFYPAGMHDMFAMIQILSTSPVTVAMNAGTIVVGALVWPLGCMFLISRLVGYRPIPLLITGAVAGSFSAFPYLMVAFGVLYPYHTAIALLPVALGLAVEALGVSRVQPTSIWAPLIALAAVLPGLALTHPSMVVALLGFAAPAVLARFVVSYRNFRSGLEPRRMTLVWAGITAAYAVGTLTAWSVLRPGLGAAPWTPFQSNARAIGEVLSSAPMGTTAAWVLLPLTIIGLYVVSRRMVTHWWLLGIYLVGALLYIIVSSWAPGALRTFVAGVWYNDSFRLAALLPIVSLPLIVLGAEWLIGRLRSVLVTRRVSDAGHATRERRVVGLRRWTAGAVPWVAVPLIALGSQGGTLAPVQDRLSEVFAQGRSSALVDTRELSVIEQVASIVPDDNAVVADPLTGGSLVYALGDRRTIAPHVFGERSTEEQYLLDHWDEAAYNAEVCPLIREFKAYYALDFGDATVIPTEDSFPGLDDLSLDLAPGIETVLQRGDAKLVRTTACG
jgi:hypothetical protein